MIVALSAVPLTFRCLVYLLYTDRTGRGGRDRRGRRARDVRPYEYAIFVPLVALILGLGLWPKALLDLTDGPVRALLGGG